LFQPGKTNSSKSSTRTVDLLVVDTGDATKITSVMERYDFSHGASALVSQFADPSPTNLPGTRLGRGLLAFPENCLPAFVTGSHLH
jgi:hypothetical protein